jgi:hypothetical protein
VYKYAVIIKAPKNLYLKRRKTMKRTAKTLLILALTLVMLFTGVPTFAAEADTGVSPRLSHMGTGSFSFSALDDGGHVSITYEGYSDSFVRAEVNVRLAKKVMLFFWEDIAVWGEESTEDWGDFYHIFELDGKGTYKATITLKIYGTDGTYDLIEDSIQSSYK